MSQTIFTSTTISTELFSAEASITPELVIVDDGITDLLGLVLYHSFLYQLENLKAVS